MSQEPWTKAKYIFFSIHHSYHSTAGSLLMAPGVPAPKYSQSPWEGADFSDMLLENGKNNGVSLPKLDYKKTATSLWFFLSCWLSQKEVCCLAVNCLWRGLCDKAHDGGLWPTGSWWVSSEALRWQQPLLWLQPRGTPWATGDSQAALYFWPRNMR